MYTRNSPLTICKKAKQTTRARTPNFLIGGLKDLSLKFEQDRLSYKLV